MWRPEALATLLTLPRFLFYNNWQKQELALKGPDIDLERAQPRHGKQGHQ